MPHSATIDIEDIGPVLFETSKRAKHLSISIRPFTGVRVAVPRGISFAKAAKLIEGKLDWIRKHLARIRHIERNGPPELPPAPSIDREAAQRRLITRLAELAALHGFTYTRVTIRCQKTRWGSCSAKNAISLNAYLTLLPGYLVDYVILHELVHTRVKNHGPRFWEALDRLCGNARALRKEMRGHSIPGTVAENPSPAKPERQLSLFE